jgi:hypothetical protein
MKYFVITGTHYEFDFFVKRKLKAYPGVFQTKDFVYVAGFETFMGHINVKGWFYGSWREREDIRLILDILSTKATMPYPDPLLRIFQEFK